MNQVCGKPLMNNPNNPNSPNNPNNPLKRPADIPTSTLHSNTILNSPNNPSNPSNPGKTGGQHQVSYNANNPNELWGVCSWECSQERLVRSSGDAIRRQLFALEQGVCQLCGLDAVELFQRYKSLAVPDR